MSRIKVENIDQRTIGNRAKRGGGGSRSALEGTTRKGGKKTRKIALSTLVFEIRSIRSQALRPTQMLRIYQLSPYKV